MPPRTIRLVEVGPRDGLQNEHRLVALDAKVEFINRLSETGLNEIEAGAFVRADRVPQLADSQEVFDNIIRKPGVTYSALVPNETGLNHALEVEADKIAVYTSASETFTRNNLNASISETLERYKPVILRAKQMGLALRAYVSTAFWCPYEGKIDPAKAADVCRRVQDLGVHEISIGDTIGKATPDEVRAFLDIFLKRANLHSIFLHFHDTFRMAVANALCAWREYGVTGFDASAGGLGACPYSPGHSGNVATEDLLYAFKASGAAVPADPIAVARAAMPLAEPLGHPLDSRLSRMASGTVFPADS